MGFRHLRRRGLLAFTVAAFLLAQPADAASCAVRSPDVLAAASDAVFSGQVAADVQLPLLPRWLRVNVIRVYRGQAAAASIVFIDGSSGVSYPPAETGSTHTFYARRSFGVFVAGGCAGSHLGEPADPESQVLGAGASPDASWIGWLDPLTAAGLLVLSLLVAGLAFARRQSRRGGTGHVRGHGV